MQFQRRCLILAIGICWTAHLSDLGAEDGRARIPAVSHFDQHIRPLLLAKCVRCHGGKSPEAELDLETPAGIWKGGESGAAITPGKPGESLLFEKIHDGSMPPQAKDRLAPQQVEAVKRWIEAGAETGIDAPRPAVIRSTALNQHDVIPILLRRCTACHGARTQEAGLDLRTKSAMLRGGKSGPAVVSTRPDESLLIRRVRSGEMPPRDRLVEASVKPIEPAELAVLERWIAAGAPEVSIAPDVATTDPDPWVTDQERDYWSFRPPAAVAIPAVRDAGRMRNPIDAFIFQKLEQQGLAAAREADPETLLRRASFDLTGLPPEPGEIEEYLSDRRDDAYERMIDRLLDSPRYGERWAHHWLDVAGYADSEGKREQDLVRPYSYRYRDYVIRAFNGDKGYDRFLLEQLAGDELTDYEHQREISPEIYDNLVATGFLRMTPDGTWANITGFVSDRLEVIADEIDVLGAAVLGLTLKCARCHSHKFDPIPQRDYYRLVDTLKGAYDEYDWLKPDKRLLPFVTAAERREWEEGNARVQREIDAERSALESKAQALTARLVESRLAELPAAIRDDLRAMLITAPGQRDAVQRYLADKFATQLQIDRDKLSMLDATFKMESEQSSARIAKMEARRPAEPRVQAIWDRGEPSPTYIYRRGDHLSPGRLVGPGVPSVLTNGRTPFDVQPPWPGARQTGRRLALAQWLVGPDHPLTARVMVNRIWKHHFGRGIVTTLGNFGKAGATPTHPELLDWLAREFVRRGWSLKAMHRLMMTSTTYRQSSTVTADHERLDPVNSLYSRMPLIRLDAEQLYDTLLFVAGRLVETPYGPGDGVVSKPDGLVTPVGRGEGWRRMIYVVHRRKQIATHLENFDFPQMNPNCIARSESTVVMQALHLMNNTMVHQLAASFAERVRSAAGSDPSAQIELMYQIAFSRRPNDEERHLGLEALQRLSERWSKPSVAAGSSDPEAARQAALTTYAHALVNSANFVYLD